MRTKKTVINLDFPIGTEQKREKLENMNSGLARSEMKRKYNKQFILTLIDKMFNFVYLDKLQ